MTAPAPQPGAGMAPQAGVGPAPQPGAGYAGFWLRFGAYIVDSIVAMIGMMIIGIPLSMLMGLSAVGTGPTAAEDLAAGVISAVISGGFFFLLIIGFTWLYFTVSESSEWQATPGKKLLGLVVTDMEGAPIGFGKANVSYWSKILSGVIMIGYIMAGFT